MPAPDAPTRPNNPHRQSAGSASVARSPSETLPSPAQRQRVTRFAVGQSRIGPRNPSHGKVPNKFPKHNPASPKAAALLKRNTSNIQLARNASSTALRKNQSETSLRKNNRSSGQLSKLPRADSSRNVNKAAKRGGRPVEGPTQAQPEQPSTNPAVHFDLGQSAGDGEAEIEGEEEEEEEEGAWENYTDSRSPSVTRSSTPRGSSTTIPTHKPDKSQAEGNSDPPDLPVRKARQPTPPSQNLKSSIPHFPAVHQQSSQAPEANRITSRLLRRNVSFNAPPQLSSMSATPVMVHAHEPKPASSATLNDTSNPEIVSRFLNNQSMSATPHDSIFLPTSTKNSPEKEEQQQDDDAEDGPRRNKSMPDVAAMRVSRTQHKLNLERESVVREPQNRSSLPNNLPPSVLRASRFSSTTIPFHDMTSYAGDGRLHPQLRHLFDQTRIEYRRVRMYQNPLASAIGRLEGLGLVPRMHISTKQKPSRKSALPSGSGDGAYGLSQSWRSHRSIKSGDARDRLTHMNGHARRPRVMFQGIDNRDEGPSSSRQSLDGHQDPEEKDNPSPRDEAKDICRRLWQKHQPVAGGE